ncbi:hypothetical protein HK096_010992, partial [Nowakowskiella sp. JEL0078]
MQQSVLDELDLMDLDAGVKKRSTDDDDFDYAYHLPYANSAAIVVHKDPTIPLQHTHKFQHTRSEYGVKSSNSALSAISGSSTQLTDRKKLLGAQLPKRATVRSRLNSKSNTTMGSKLGLNAQSSTTGSRYIGFTQNEVNSSRGSKVIPVGDEWNENDIAGASDFLVDLEVSTFRALPYSITKWVPAKLIAWISFAIITIAVIASIVTTGVASTTTNSNLV